MGFFFNPWGNLGGIVVWTGSSSDWLRMGMVDMWRQSMFRLLVLRFSMRGFVCVEIVIVMWWRWWQRCESIEFHRQGGIGTVAPDDSVHVLQFIYIWCLIFVTHRNGTKATCDGQDIKTICTSIGTDRQTNHQAKQQNECHTASLISSYTIDSSENLLRLYGTLQYRLRVVRVGGRFSSMLDMGGMSADQAFIVVMRCNRRWIHRII